VIVASGVTAALKLAVGRRRPSGDGDAGIFRPFSGWSSFPSGHTALSFALATALAAERRDGWSDAALYGAAGATAFARLNDDRHWLTDVLAGALVGHLTARLLLHRHSRVSLGPTGPAVSIAF
jgi:membrane-associated phospholipid phosphatase